jgi:formate dehydrogenase subunit gamma
MPRRTRLAIRLPAAIAATIVLICAVAFGQGGSAPPVIARDDTESCLACHRDVQGEKRAVNAAALAASPHGSLKCQDCHSTVTAAPHTPTMLKEKAACAACHADEAAAYDSGVHARADKKPGDHPTCASCHGAGDPHAIVKTSAWSRTAKVEMCSACHKEPGRMARYGADSDAVPSYMESFHGRALMRFGLTRAAICSDCHRNHDVLAPSDPRAPTHRNNAAANCSQAGCHVGAKVNFAMSGANHLRLKLKSSPVLLGILWFFWALLTFTSVSMIAAVGLDLRRKVLSRSYKPRCGRPAALMITVSYVCLVSTLMLAALSRQEAQWTAVGAGATMVLAYVVYLIGPGKSRTPIPAGEKSYPRLTVCLRAQHIVLFACFTILALTGLPLRFSHFAWAQGLYLMLGGPGGARIVHRVAAVILIAGWLWHFAWLFVRWKRAGWSLHSWTMLPARKDIFDAIGTAKLYFGLTREEPKYERFQFREKADYFAEYWGMPVMVLSGFVLWFPTYWGSRLPEIGLPVAIVAHGYEATLAFIAIITWHLYNAHFNPDCFPGQRVWMTGTLSREEMERDHALELERIEQTEPPRDTNPPEA